MELNGKTVLFLGSSVTYGAMSNGISFADIMAETCAVKMIKEAVSGTTLADIDESSYVARLKKIDRNRKVDLFICQLSTNDAGRNIPFQQTERALRFIIEYVKASFDCPIVFYTGTYFENKHYEQLVKILVSLQKEYDFYILNLWDDAEMLSVSETDYKKYMADSVHPTLIGYREWWTPKFIRFCRSIEAD